MDNVIRSVEKTINNAIGSIMTGKIELAVFSIKAMSSQDIAILVVSSGHEEKTLITCHFLNALNRSSKNHDFNLNDETRGKNP